MIKKFIYWKILYLAVITLSFSFPGNTTPKKQRIIIEGNITGLSAKTLYLRTAFNRRNLDSAICTDGNFKFNLEIPNFEPILVSLVFRNEDQKLILISFRNSFLSNDKKEYKTTAFYLDTGITHIKGSFQGIVKNTPSTNPVTVIGSKQNEPFFLTQLLDFAVIDPRKDSTLRNKDILDLKDWIKRYPNSFWFMTSLYAYKRFYSNAELLSFYRLFNPILRSSEQGKSLFEYASANNKINVKLEEFLGKDSLNNSLPLINKGNPTLIIFWASWCAPCRKETPYLKKIFEDYSKDDSHRIKFISVSIDNDETLWKNALLQDKMPWQQLIVSDSQSTFLLKELHFDAIPFLLLVDSNGKEYARFKDGYSGSPNKELEKKIFTLLEAK